MTPLEELYTHRLITGEWDASELVLVILAHARVHHPQLGTTSVRLQGVVPVDAFGGEPYNHTIYGGMVLAQVVTQHHGANAHVTYIGDDADHADHAFKRACKLLTEAPLERITQ